MFSGSSSENSPYQKWFHFPWTEDGSFGGNVSYVFKAIVVLRFLIKLLLVTLFCYVFENFFHIIRSWIGYGSGVMFFGCKSGSLSRHPYDFVSAFAPFLVIEQHAQRKLIVVDVTEFLG